MTVDFCSNRDAELAILGIAMNDAACAQQLAAMREDLFTGKDTAAVFRAVRRLVEKGAGCDLLTVSTEAQCDLDAPHALLVECVSRGFSPAMYRQYETILADCRKRRTMADMGQRLLADANNPAVDLDYLTSYVIGALQQADGSSHSVSMHDAVAEYLAWIDSGVKNLSYSGMPDLDSLVGGFSPGQYIAIGARPAVGKSAFALAVAVNIARKRGPVLIVSLEMPAMQIAGRQIAAESGISSKKARMSQLDFEAYKALYAACQEVADLPIRITYEARTPLQVRREAVWMQNRDGLAAIVIDYIGLMSADGKTAGRYDKMTEVSNALKVLALELKVPIFVLTQFNRMSEAGQSGRAEKRPPNMSEAKDSGAIEQDADVFLTLFDPPMPEMAPGDPCWEAWCACDRNRWSWLTVIIAKNRDGDTGLVHLGFDKPRMKFHSLALPEVH